MRKLSVNILKALSGDAIFLSYLGNDNNMYHVLIDGGMPNTYTQSIKKYIAEIDKLNHIFLTHIDRDHIGGILKLLKSTYENKIEKICFNSGNMIKISDSSFVSENDGKELVKYINDSTGIKVNKEAIVAGSIFDLNGLNISFLSPTDEALNYFSQNYLIGEIKLDALISDTQIKEAYIPLEELSKIQFQEKILQSDVANGVSLAMLLKYDDKTILLMGDAKDKVVIESLKKMNYKDEPNQRLVVDYLKLSHHGSKFHTNNEFLSLVECQNYIISTNGSGNSKHPHVEVFARILCHPNRDMKKKIYFYFNYPKNEYQNKGIRLLSSEEEIKYNCESIYDKTLFEIVSKND